MNEYSFEPGDSVFVENVGDNPVEFGWGYPKQKPRRWVVEAGQKRVIPIDPVINVTGDPRAGGEPRLIKWGEETILIPSRRQERVRLQQRYGITDGSEDEMPEIVTYRKDKTGEIISTMQLPRLIVSLEDGTVLPTVLADPMGEGAGVESAVGNEPTMADMLKLIERQQRQLNILKDQAGIARDAENLTDLPADDHDAPVAKRKPGRPPKNPATGLSKPKLETITSEHEFAGQPVGVPADDD